MSIASRNLPYTEISSTDQLLQVRTLLNDEPDEIRKLLGFEVKTVIIDTIDEIQRIVIAERNESQGQDQATRNDWNYIATTMRAIVGGFRNLDMNVIFTCHIKEAQEGDGGKTYFKPQLQGAFVEDMPAAVDLAVLIKERLTVAQTEKGVEYRTSRTLQTYKDNQHDWVKDRSGKLPREFEINFTDDYQRLYDAIYGDIDELGEFADREVEVAVPVLIPPRPPEQPATRRRQVARPMATTTTPTARPPRPALPSQAPVEEQPSLLEASSFEAETELIQPAVEENIKNTDIKIRNPENAMPAPGLVLKPLGYGSDIYCQSCGDELGEIPGDRDKKPVPVEEQVSFGLIRFRKVLCVGCFNAEKR